MERFLQDIRYAARSLRKSPVFATIAILCLTLGIATNTTLFSCLNAIVLRPFPFENPDELVSVWEFNPKTNNRSGVSYPNYVDWRDGVKSLSAMAAYSGRSVAITEGTEPARLQGQLVTANLFLMLGIRPQLGRLFRDDEDKAGAPGAVLLSDAAWRRLYAADSAVLNRVISVNNLPYTVVGVMPPKFKFPENSEIWLPMGPVLHNDKREWRSSNVIARLGPGVKLEAANRDLADFSRRLNAQYGIDRGDFRANARALREEFGDRGAELIVKTMMGAVTFVLLIACANVANLMLTRSAAREREIAIRAAIGAGRGRIVRQLLTEAVILSVIAGVIATPLAWEGIRLIYQAIPAEDPIPYYMEFSMDRPTLLYTALVSLVTGIVFGLAPALQSTRGALHEALKDGGRGAGGGSVRKNRLRSALVVAEVGLSVVLLVGASLFVRSYLKLQNKPLGFDTAPVMTMRFFLPGTRYDSTSAKAIAVEDIVRRVEALPGVAAATISNLIPIDGGGNGDGVIIDGHPVEAGKEPSLRWTSVMGRWPETFGMKLVAGRTFTDQELRDSSRVALVDQTMVAKFWPNASAVGQRFRLANDKSRQWTMVIGVVSTIRTTGLDNTGPVQPMAYLPYRFLPARNHGLMVRVRNGDAAAITSAVRGAIRASDPAIPVFNVATMEKVRELSFWQYRLFGIMFGTFGAIALFLAAIGVYGVISYGVSQRTREIGVRVALGAQQPAVIGLIVKQGMFLAFVGIAFGLVGSFGVTRVVASMLIDVSPTDPPSFVGVSIFLAIVALVASFVPARRATAVDPIIALRAE